MGTDRGKHRKGHTTYRPRSNGGYKWMEAGTEEHRVDVVFVCGMNQRAKEPGDTLSRATNKQC